MSAIHRIFHRLWLVLAFLAVTLNTAARADSVPFWGAKTSVPIDTPLDKLKKGEFLWIGDAVTSGPIVMVVSVTEQRAYVYRNGILIGATTVSTGRPGHVTPTGVFTVLQKQKEHRSTIYDGAPMPYMERLTWGGVALHAGGLPGYPESHGCIHLPSQFARLLFDISPNGMTVVIGAEHPSPNLRPFSLIASTYDDGSGIGTVGIIGPTRMHYSRAIAMVDDAADAVSRVLREQN